MFVRVSQEKINYKKMKNSTKHVILSLLNSSTFYVFEVSVRIFTVVNNLRITWNVNPHGGFS